MASPVSHIIYAKKYLEKHPMNKADEEMFFLGCLFPDIRRIDPKISRKETHLFFPDLNLDANGLDSFHFGWKFHLYCDMKREEILNRKNFYSLKNTKDFWGISAKSLEESLIYSEYNNWEKLINFLNNAPFIETSINVSRETFGLWYAILAKYFEKKPDQKSVRIFLAKQPALSEINRDIVRSMDKLGKNGKVIEILSRVKDEII
ncbi:MAG: hypothetical protein COU40_00355 [Candidatus Moranbacteria bacterium CG10_big_fil_rev_8_21_14_0_10_35_21]|nr:MAG: hypothetical protein COU40_00355 [Candidatus Moranbacteria bacterium CG10_big_fil_rev_8_21_14_0_10_35_21]PJA88345.1 MAG: hypothetical protein CO139_03665 [Candidatus Moranbacteria bacterium CG_4_9_14_3_um_filter_36_9]